MINRSMLVLSISAMQAAIYAFLSQQRHSMTASAQLKGRILTIEGAKRRDHRQKPGQANSLEGWVWLVCDAAERRLDSC
jgi:hypothetical protein